MPVVAQRSDRSRRSAPRHRGDRLLLGTALSTVVTGFVLAAPVVTTGSATTPAALDSSSSTATRFAEESSPVVMGQDGLDPSSPAAIVPQPAAAVPPPVAEVPAPAPAEATASEATAAAPETTTEAVASAAPEPSVAIAAGEAAPGLEGEVLAMVNAERAAAGCGALVHDDVLAGVARAHSADMRDRDFFDHVNPDGRDPFDRADAAGQTNARAENIASGQADPAAVMEAWMKSADHRANILDCELKTLGVGIAEGAGGPWWTQLFGD